MPSVRAGIEEGLQAQWRPHRNKVPYLLSVCFLVAQQVLFWFFLDENGIIPVRMIKLEPDIDTRYYGDEEDERFRPQVKMEENDDDYYYNHYSEDEDYYPPVKVPKKRGRPMGFRFPGETKAKRGRKKGTSNKTINGVKIWKVR